MLDAEKDRDSSPQEVQHVQKLHDRIKHFDGLLKGRRIAWKNARKYVDGNPNDDGGKGLVRVNLIGGFLETLQANIYAKAPEIAVTPEERPDEQEYASLGAVSKTLQAALNTYLVKDALLKKRGKTAVRAALTTSTGWVKVLYQKDKAQEPVVRNNLNDVQENIAKIDALRKETEDQAQCNDYDVKLISLRQQEAALMAQPEVMIAQGLVIDNVPSEDIIVLDASVRDADEIPQSSAIAHRIKMSGAAFKAKFGMSPPKSAQVEDPEGGDKNTQVDDDDKLVIVYEVWSKDDNSVYTLCKGVTKYIRDPYQPAKLGDRWYPFFPLQLRRVDGVLYPLSIVELLIELQDEYNTRHTRASEHRRKNIPVRLINKASNITDEEIRAINNRAIGTDVVAVTTDPNQPLQNQLGHMSEIPFNPAMYDAADVMRDMEMVAGVQDASRGAINKAKTATEAEIMAQGMQSRSSETIDSVEEWLTEIADYSAQLLFLNVSQEQIKDRLGKTAMWPEITARQQLRRLGITIRSGSTSRPNKMRERDQWIQLMPMMQEALTKSAELKAQGQDDLAKATLKILQETLSRFDEKLDIKEFLGISLEDAEQPEIPQEVQQVIEQGKQQIQQLQEQLQIAGDALKSKVDDMNLEREKATISANSSLEVAAIKSEADKASKIEQAAINADVERERIASNERIALARELMTKMPSEAIEPDEDSLSTISPLVDAMQSGLAQMSAQIAQAMTAPRQLIRDESGNAVGSVVQPFQEQ